MLHVFIGAILFALICVVIFNYKRGQVEDAKELIQDFEDTFHTNGFDPDGTEPISFGTQKKQSL